MDLTTFPHARVMPVRARARAVSIAAAMLLVAATPGRADLSAGFVNTRTEMPVEAVTPRGPYLEIQTETSGEPFFLYVEPSEVCRRIAGATSVTYLDDGPLGVLEAGEDTCQVYGVGNLTLWRDRRSSSTRDSSRTVPRSQARFETLYRDDAVALLRGSFPQAARLGFTGYADLIAVVPIDDVCAAPIESGVASIEFRPKGDRALSLVGKSGLCTILGLINPLPESKPSKKED